MAEPKKNRRKWIVLSAKLLIVAIVVWWITRTFRDAFAELGQREWHVNPAWLLASGGLYLLGLLPSALYWHHVLRVMGQQAGVLETVRAYYIGHLGKYVPGKAMVVVLRAGLIRSHRVDTTLATVSVFIETLTMMACGSAMAAVLLAIQFREEGLMLTASLALLFVAGIPTMPSVFRWLAGKLLRGKMNDRVREGLANVTYRTLALGWLATGIGWILLALSLWATLKGVGAPPVELLSELNRYLAAVTLAVVAGFLSLIPGGAGVRELVFMKFLDREPYSQVTALVATVMLRLVWLVAELVISGILYMCGPRGKNAP
jgi:uncharacterized membrane protein YbhN (UPF0104 family)